MKKILEQKDFLGTKWQVKDRSEAIRLIKAAINFGAHPQMDKGMPLFQIIYFSEEPAWYADTYYNPKASEMKIIEEFEKFHPEAKIMKFDDYFEKIENGLRVINEGGSDSDRIISLVINKREHEKINEAIDNMLNISLCDGDYEEFVTGVGEDVMTEEEFNEEIEFVKDLGKRLKELNSREGKNDRED